MKGVYDMFNKKKDIEEIIKKDLKEFEDSRNTMIEALKNKAKKDQEVEWIIENLLIHNVVIDELEHILKRYNKKKESE